MGEGKKPKLGDMRACARGIFVAFPDLASCGSEGAGRGWGRWAESSPISWKSAQGLSRVLLLFRRNGVDPTRAGAARRFRLFVTRLGPRRAPLASRAPAHLGGFAVGGRTIGMPEGVFPSHGGRNGLEVHCDVRKKYRRFFGEMK